MSDKGMDIPPYVDPGEEENTVPAWELDQLIKRLDSQLTALREENERLGSEGEALRKAAISLNTQLCRAEAENERLRTELQRDESWRTLAGARTFQEWCESKRRVEELCDRWRDGGPWLLSLAEVAEQLLAALRGGDEDGNQEQPR